MVKKIIIIVSIIIILSYIIYKETRVTDSTEFIDKIDSLESVVDSLSIKRESLEKKIDTVYITIHKNILKYEENRNNILDNNVSENYEFFSGYITKYKSRYDSINNF